MNLNTDYVYDWVWEKAGMDLIIPPLCLEVVLVDGSRYNLHSIPAKDEGSKSLVLRIWDFRAFEEQDVEDLKHTLGELTSGSALDHPGEIHPKLDWADLHLHLGDIHCFIVWNEKLWPREDRPQIGFGS